MKKKGHEKLGLTEEMEKLWVKVVLVVVGALRAVRWKRGSNRS